MGYLDLRAFEGERQTGGGGSLTSGHRFRRYRFATILREHGLEPAPDRLKKTTWTEFLKTHWEELLERAVIVVGGRREMQLGRILARVTWSSSQS